jgi:hypothetical protein
MERASEHGIEQQRKVKASLFYLGIPIALSPAVFHSD